MMTSLFSSFDPSTSMTQMNWMIMMMTLTIMPMNFWIKKSRWNMLKTTMEKKMNEDFWNNTNHKEMLSFSSSIMITIFLNNLLGLFPYNFTTTSHMCISISLALPMWITMMTYGWTKFTNEMFTHLLPTSTPTMIMPMMILIETIGNIIRPISLSVRLSANMIAGHLLMILLGSINEINLLIMTIVFKTTLMMFEMAISIIQAYVFATLITLYSSEIP
uniref:ATP synthase F0 subunit 6 n=1 Tax=Pseudochoutagus curvativus TaxID=3081119 RepID=UPI002A800108|nr:ATP synthase F0 subunit 6 [Pseudochoutagus curvativus]WOW98896.1 ATP synthase F0 subunit 6 [Pseudochoutagus curvativus]